MWKSHVVVPLGAGGSVTLTQPPTGDAGMGPVWSSPPPEPSKPGCHLERGWSYVSLGDQAAVGLRRHLLGPSPTVRVASGAGIPTQVTDATVQSPCLISMACATPFSSKVGSEKNAPLTYCPPENPLYQEPLTYPLPESPLCKASWVKQCLRFPHSLVLVLPQERTLPKTTRQTLTPTPSHPSPSTHTHTRPPCSQQARL